MCSMTSKACASERKHYYSISYVRVTREWKGQEFVCMAA